MQKRARPFARYAQVRVSSSRVMCVPGPSSVSPSSNRTRLRCFENGRLHCYSALISSACYVPQKEMMVLSTDSPAMTSLRSRCSQSRGRSRSRKITHNTTTKTKKQQQQVETTTLRISDEDGNIVEIEAERTGSMQEVFDCELLCYFLCVSLFITCNPPLH